MGSCAATPLAIVRRNSGASISRFISTFRIEPRTLTSHAGTAYGAALAA